MKSLWVIGRFGCLFLFFVPLLAQKGDPSPPAEVKAVSEPIQAGKPDEKKEEQVAAKTPRADVVITVIGTRTERPLSKTPGSMAVVTANDVEIYGDNNFGDVVGREPLVSAPFELVGASSLVPYNNGGYLSYNVRGVESNRILVTIDGIRQPDEFLFAGQERVGRDYFDPAVFSALEILKGPGSSLYGSDALGGAFAMRTKGPADLVGDSGEPRAFSFRSAYNGNDDSYLNLFSAAFQNDRVSGSLVYSHRDGNASENQDLVDPDPVDYQSDSILAKLSAHAGSQHTFSFTGEYFKRKTDTEVNNLESTTVFNFPGFYFRSVTDEVTNGNDRDRQRLSVEHLWNPGGRFNQVKTLLYIQESESRDTNFTSQLISNMPDNSDEFQRIRSTDTAYRTRIYGLSSQVEQSFLTEKTQHRMVWGLEVSSSFAEKPFLRTQTALGQSSLTSTPHMAPTDTFRAGLFVQDEIQWGTRGQWLVIPGARLEHYEVNPDNTPEYLAQSLNTVAPDFDLTSFSPKISLLYQFTSEWNGYGQYSRGFRSPNAEELTATISHAPPAGVRTIPNPGLKEERSDAYEFGFKGDFSGLTFRTAAFLTRFDNFIEQFIVVGEELFVPDDPSSEIVTLYQTQNIGEAEIYGLEVAVSLPLGHYNPRLEGVDISLSSGYSVGKDLTNDVYLDSVEPLSVILQIGYDAPDHRYGLRLLDRYVDEKTKTQATLVPPSYHEVNLTGYLGIGESWRFNAGIRNLLDETYWLWSSYRQGGHFAPDGMLDRRASQPGRNLYLSANLRF